MLVEPLCAACRFYRVKGEIGDGLPEHEIGICDNEAFNAQVKVSGLSLVRRMLEMLGYSGIGIDEFMLDIGIRVRGDFGCRHFEAQEEETEP